MITKRSKVHRLPTKDNKPAIWLHDDNTLINNTKSPILNKWFDVTGHHLYFTTDEETKEGDWCIAYDRNNKNPYVLHWTNIGTQGKAPFYKKEKIVATTDKSLKRGVNDPHNIHSKTLPEPTKSFVEAYVKAGGIDEVLIEYGHFNGKYNDWRVEQIKIDSHNTITIHPIKTSWNLEELTVLLERCTYDNTGIKLRHVHMEVKNWIKQNVN